MFGGLRSRAGEGGVVFGSVGAADDDCGEHDEGCDEADGEVCISGLCFMEFQVGAESPDDDDADEAARAVEDVGEGCA